jgi:hypothetical protein
MLGSNWYFVREAGAIYGKGQWLLLRWRLVKKVAHFVVPYRNSPSTDNSQSALTVVCQCKRGVIGKTNPREIESRNDDHGALYPHCIHVHITAHLV